jgi:hypothetical protein
MPAKNLNELIVIAAATNRTRHGNENQDIHRQRRAPSGNPNLGLEILQSKHRRAKAAPHRKAGPHVRSRREIRAPHCQRHRVGQGRLRGKVLNGRPSPLRDSPSGFPTDPANKGRRAAKSSPEPRRERRGAIHEFSSFQEFSRPTRLRPRGRDRHGDTGLCVRRSVDSWIDFRRRIGRTIAKRRAAQWRGADIPVTPAIHRLFHRNRTPKPAFSLRHPMAG